MSSGDSLGIASTSARARVRRQGDRGRSARSPRTPSPNRTSAAAAHPPPGRARCRCRRSRPTSRSPAAARRGSGNMLVRIDSVAGNTRAAPTPVNAAQRDELGRVDRERRSGRSDAEHDEPGRQRTAPAEPVAERSRGEQQAGEHHGVAVDDPLQRARGGVQAVDQGRQRHVEDGGVDGDDHQREAQHAQRPPLAGVGGRDPGQ